MFKLDSYVSVAVCAKTAKERREWVKFWENVFQSTTATIGIGYWEGIREASILVRHWTERPAAEVLADIVPWLKVYQTGAAQKAVFVEVGDKGKVTAYVVDNSAEWDDVLADLDEGLALANWFDQLAAEHGK